MAARVVSLGSPGWLPSRSHCLTLSVGSEATADALGRVEAVGDLVRASGVDHVSDHLAFSRVGTTTLPHFVPLWRTEDQLELVSQNVDRIQSRLGVPLLLENPASPLDPGGDMSTAEFLNRLCAVDRVPGPAGPRERTGERGERAGGCGGRAERA